ncbi:hypothetical protein ACFFU8_09430 [Chromobacterium piscinae]|uniref:hypothetical protein n=1 Tax=Chromobacterium piscinae TaxID=686831 RepID=UPI001E4E6AB5|nr:hypothetical protein [Chromobacterium piscinae]MCD5327874.1 hypothetical protein [Chromobacterium piscinae]
MEPAICNALVNSRFVYAAYGGISKMIYRPKLGKHHMNHTGNAAYELGYRQAIKDAAAKLALGNGSPSKAALKVLEMLPDHGMESDGISAEHLRTWLVTHLIDDIHNSRWYRTAPAAEAKNMTIELLGIEKRTFHSMLGGSSERECLVIECEIAGDRQQYITLLDQLIAQQSEL